ncbi:MAG: hypothetical protein VKJ85_05115 [Prochlorothrix sp.]|nr:hypothetical protein [Prochlorothrix sp.]
MPPIWLFRRKWDAPVYYDFTQRPRLDQHDSIDPVAGSLDSLGWAASPPNPTLILTGVTGQEL